MWNFAGLVAFGLLFIAYEWWQDRKPPEVLTAVLADADTEWFPKLEAKRVIVHTGEHSIEGVLTGIYSDCVVIAHARYLLNATDIQPLDGEQVVPRPNIEWVEVLSAGTPQP